MSKKNPGTDQNPDQFSASMPEGLSAAPPTTDEGAKREGKLSKSFPEDRPSVVIITIKNGAKGPMEFDTSLYPGNIQTRLPAFGAGHKLGDAASGKTGTEAEEAIMKVHEAMEKGEWIVKGTPTPRVSIKEIAGNLDKLPESERAAAIATLLALGITIPGLSPAVEVA